MGDSGRAFACFRIISFYYARVLKTGDAGVPEYITHFRRDGDPEIEVPRKPDSGC